MKCESILAVKFKTICRVRCAVYPVLLLFHVNNPFILYTLCYLCVKLFEWQIFNFAYMIWHMNCAVIGSHDWNMINISKFCDFFCFCLSHNNCMHFFFVFFSFSLHLSLALNEYCLRFSPTLRSCPCLSRSRKSFARSLELYFMLYSLQFSQFK